MAIIGYNSIGPEAATGNWGLVLLTDTSVGMSENSDLGSGYCYCAWTSTVPIAIDGLIQLLVYEIGVDDENSPLVAESNVLTLDVGENSLAWREFTFPATVLESGKNYAVCVLTNVGQFLQQPVIMPYLSDASSVRDWNLAGSPAGTLPDAPADLDGMGGSNNTQISVYAEYAEAFAPTSVTDTLTIISNALIVDPNIFTFAAPSVGATVGASDFQDATTFDIKLRHDCNHTLTSGQFTLGTCPRCLGTGYYYDAKFNAVGKLIELSLEDKLQQALEKLVLTDENKFHDELAVGLQKWIGAVSLGQIKTIIQYELGQGVASLKGSQKRIVGLNPRAQIAFIDNIDITATSIDTLRYIVTVTTISGVTTNLTGFIDFSEIVSN